MEGSTLEMPKTITPEGVYLQLLAIIIIMFAGIAYLDIFEGISTMSITILLILAFTTKFYVRTVPGYHAHIVLNLITRKQRTMFQGFNLKLPWEQDVRTIDLRSETHNSSDETYATEDALMKVTYVYTIRPNISGKDPGKDIVLYASYDADAIEASGKALFSRLLSDYYRPKNAEDLKDKTEINKLVFKSGNGKTALDDFQKSHGVIVGVGLTDSDFDEATQKYRDTISNAQSFGEAIKALMKENVGMTVETASNIVKLMNLPNTSESTYVINATGLDSLRDIIVPGASGLAKKNEKK